MNGNMTTRRGTTPTPVTSRKERYKTLWTKDCRKRLKRLRKLAVKMSTDTHWFIVGLSDDRQDPWIQPVHSCGGTITKGKKTYVKEI